MGKAYGKTPYELLLRSSFVAFNFNRAAYIFGNRVDNLLAQEEQYKEGGQTKTRKKYTVEQAIEEASKNPKKSNWAGFNQLFAGL